MADIGQRVDDSYRARYGMRAPINAADSDEEAVVPGPVDGAPSGPRFDPAALVG